MASDGFSTNIHDHGATVADKKNKVQCHYCKKVVSGFYRLKCHLGAIRGDVLPCEEVPTVIKEFFRQKIIEQKAEKFSEEVGETAILQIGGQKSRADICIDSASLTGESHAEVVKLRVAQFFYESGIDFSCVNIASFQRMLNSILGQQLSDCQLFPTLEELEGKMLKDLLRTVHEKADIIRNSWAQSGCSILLDEWDNYQGRHMVNFLVDCPEGPIYLHSVDITNIKNSNALQLLMYNVIHEVGMQNVVQIIASYGSWMLPVIKKIAEQHISIFQVISASECIDHILHQIADRIPDIKAVTGMSNDLFTFLYRNTAFSEMFGGFSHDEILIKLCNFPAAEPFLMLENLLLKKGSLECMIRSSEWNISCLSKPMEGQQASNLINDSSFWIQAKRANKATSALLCVLDLIVSSDKPFLGFIYETMDQVKERIRNELVDESAFMPFWELIDDTWNNLLHCPLHAAAYYLNPCFFYSEDFNLDDEVNDGLMCCIISMVQDQPTKNLVLEQLQSYKNGHGPFKRGMSGNIIKNVDPVSWWVKYGNHCPELQRFSIRILSQACDGALRYGLRRSLAEKLLTGSRSSDEQERLQDLTYVHYNLQLWRNEPR